MEAYVWYTPGVGLIKMIVKEKRTRSGDSVPTPPESGEVTIQLQTFK